MILILAALCGLMEAIFTALEVALGTVSRARLRALATPALVREEEGHETVPAATSSRAALVLSLLERPDKLTLLFICVTSLSLWSAATLLTWQMLRGDWPEWGLGLALVALLFVAEVLPLQIAARNSEAIALYGAGLVRFTQRLLSPLTLVVGGIAYGMARLLGSGPNATPQVTEGELRTALAAAEEEGVIESEERALIEGAMDLREKTVREVMTPRMDIQGVPADATLSVALQMALSEGHSRLPVYEGSLDHIVGVLATKDLLPHLRNGQGDSKTVREVARPPFFIPDTKRIDSTLEELRRQRTLLAIVAAPEGGTAGLVTLEDLLEELVGEIQDEYDVEEAPLRVEGEGDERYVIGEATSSVRDFGRFFAREWKMTPTLRGRDGSPAPSSQSLAALAMELFESVPSEGDAIRGGDAITSASNPDARAEFGLQLEIAKMDGPRIEDVRVRLVQE